MGNSFSDISVSKAVDWLKEIDRESVSYVQFLSPEIYDEIFDFPSSMGFEERQKKLWLAKNDFFTAVVQGILEHFFDGNLRDFDKYQKTALKDAYNFGFMANYAKSYGKMLTNSRRDQSELHRKGTKWFNDYFCDQCIVADKRLDELEEEKNAEEERQYQELMAEEEITNSEKFLKNLVDDEDKRFALYEHLLNFERKSNFNLDFDEDAESIKDKQNEANDSTDYDFGKFVTPQLSLQLCTTGQKVLSACGLNTDISLRLRKYNGKDFEEIETHKFHKFGKILSQDNGFLLTDINLPEPENLNEALLMRETGGSVYKLDINMTGKAKDTYNDNALIVMGCTFDLKPISQSNIKTSMDDLYSDLSSSDDRIDEYKADAIADLLVERNTIIQNYVRIHQSWGVERKEYYDEFSNMDLEDVSSVIRQNVKFFLAPDSPIDIYSTSTLHGGERRKFYEKSGTFFDDFDAID